MTDNPTDPEPIYCSWCEEHHSSFWLCEPAAQVLTRLKDQVAEGAARYDMPTMEFTNEIGEAVEGIMCKAMAVRAFYTDTLGVYRPGIAIDPVMLDDSSVKPLIMVDTDVNIRRIGRLFDDMSSLAVRRARRARDQAFKHRSI